jgi:hypothetical protein
METVCPSEKLVLSRPLRVLSQMPGYSSVLLDSLYGSRTASEGSFRSMDGSWERMVSEAWKEF